MAISPPSDIVLDVARAVEPADIDAARTALIKRTSGVMTANASGTFSLIEAGKVDARALEGTASAKSPESYKKFEAMVLQTFIQNMLPKDGSSVYGKGVAGDMWKSLMAEKIADVMADRGGIGIADRMMGDHYMQGEKKVSVGAVSSSAERAESDHQTMLSEALVQEMQRKLARTLAEDHAATGSATKI